MAMPEFNIQSEQERTPRGVQALYDRVFYTSNSKIYYSARHGFAQERFHTNGRGVKEQRLFSGERGLDGKHRVIAEEKNLPADLPTVPTAAVITIKDRWGNIDTGLMCNGKREGVWMHTEARKLDGYTYTTETPYVAGMRQGLQISRYPDGAVHSKVPFADDKENGVRMLYHPNGAVEGRLEMRDNRVHGARYLWHDNGKPRLRARHKDGEMLGNCLSWSYYGTSLEKCEYNGKGRQIGMRYSYNVDRSKKEDRLTLTHQYDNGDGTPGIGKWVVMPERNVLPEENKPSRGEPGFFRQFGRMIHELTHRRRDKAVAVKAPAETPKADIPSPP